MVHVASDFHGTIDVYVGLVGPAFFPFLSHWDLQSRGRVRALCFHGGEKSEKEVQWMHPLAVRLGFVCLVS
jgi:hypothetical protein